MRQMLTAVKTYLARNFHLRAVAWRHRHGMDLGLIRANTRDILNNLPYEGLLKLIFGDIEFDKEDERRLKDATDHIDIVEASEVPVFAAEITSDGRTVWVNAPNCIGRFTQDLGEVYLFGEDNIQTPPDWEAWLEAMAENHNVTISNVHQPLWVGEGS